MTTRLGITIRDLNLLTNTTTLRETLRIFTSIIPYLVSTYWFKINLSPSHTDQVNYDAVSQKIR